MKEETKIRLLTDRQLDYVAGLYWQYTNFGNNLVLMAEFSSVEDAKKAFKIMEKHCDSKLGD